MNKLVAIALPLLAVAAPASAAQVYNAPSGLVGNQAWTGSLGLDFTVRSAIKVTSIGVFDSGSDGLSSSLAVTIYNATTGVALFAPVTFASGTVNSSGDAYLFQAITPLVLLPGSYQVTAWNYSGSEPNFNYGFIASGSGGPVTFDSLGGRLTAVSPHYSNASGVFATILDDGNTRYGAGSFLAVGVPEPAEWALMLGGFGMLGMALRCRRRTTVVFS